MRETFTFNVRRCAEDTYRPELLGTVEDALRRAGAHKRSPEFVAACVAKDGEAFKRVPGLGVETTGLTYLEALAAINLACMHVNNLGYRYWYRYAQLALAHEVLAKVRGHHV